MSKTRTQAARKETWLLGLLVLAASVLRAEITGIVEHNDNERASSAFTFTNISRPAPAVAAAGPKFVIVEGQPDPNSAGVSALTDGRFPEEEDEPAANFFFKEATAGGRLLLDLGAATAVREIDSFSWHPGSRAPQVYALYVSDGTSPGFHAQPKRPTNPSTVGWKLLTNVDTRSSAKDNGGQYGVHLTTTSGLGTFRYALFDIR